jgi:UDP-glucose 4-epimerase
VTGAAGYLGGRFVADMMTRTERPTLRALVRDRVPDYLAADEVVTLDLSAPGADVAAACEGVDAIVHLAASNEDVARADPELALVNTVRATHTLARGAAAAGVRRLVYVSTMHVYGAAIVGGSVIVEETLPMPRTTYAIARLASEHLVAAETSTGIDAVVFRLTNAVGPPLSPAVARWTLVTNDLCRQAVMTGELRLHSHGLQWRDFIALEDVCRVLDAAIARDRVPAGTYNLGSGSPRTIREMASVVQDAAELVCGRRPPLIAPDPPPDTPTPYTIDVSRLRRLGLVPALSVREAVEGTLRFCCEHRDELRRLAPGEAP